MKSLSNESTYEEKREWLDNIEYLKDKKDTFFSDCVFLHAIKYIPTNFLKRSYVVLLLIVYVLLRVIFRSLEAMKNAIPEIIDEIHYEYTTLSQIIRWWLPITIMEDMDKKEKEEKISGE